MATVLILFFAGKYLANKIELKKTLYISILIFFFGINIYYLLFVPDWVNKYKLSEINEYIEDSNKKEIVYIGSNYRYNPQFSFYFKGLNLNWENPEYKFQLLDLKEKAEEVKVNLSILPEGKYFFIVEKDKINRAEYPSSELFIPKNCRLVKKENGYELYEN